VCVCVCVCIYIFLYYLPYICVSPILPLTHTQFPLPYTELYDTRPAPQPARFHADSAGSFETAPGGVLRQAQPLYPRGTEWIPDYDPITSLGSVSWADITASINVNILPAQDHSDAAVVAPHPLSGMFEGEAQSGPISEGAYTGVCVRQWDQWDSGYCLLVGAGLRGAPGVGCGWVLQAGTGSGQRVPGTILASGALPSSFNLSAWHRLVLGARGPVITASLDGNVVANVTATRFTSGLVSLRSGYHLAQFDNLHLSGQTPPTDTLLDTVVPLGCNRRDFTGPVGVSVLAVLDFEIRALGRYGTTKLMHNLYVADAVTKQTLASVQIPPSSTTDAYGFLYGTLATPVRVLAGQRVLILSNETLGGDPFCDRASVATARPPKAADIYSVYYDKTGWNVATPGSLYGPVNALFA
jgi:hypothetical protein